jgi:large repetitive protein
VRGLPVEAQSADGAEVDAYSVSAVDLVDGPVTPTCSPAAPHGFGLGETTVDCTASDGAGNKATASFKVIVRDTTPPELPVIPDKSVETYSRGGTTVEYETPEATDTVDHDVTVTCAPASNQVFKVGTNPVKCTATDDAGNQAERSFNITVELLTYGPNGNPGPGQGEQANPRAR